MLFERAELKNTSNPTIHNIIITVNEQAEGKEGKTGLPTTLARVCRYVSIISSRVGAGSLGKSMVMSQWL